MKRALSFCLVLLSSALAQPAIAANRPSDQPACVQASSIENWRVHTARGVSIDVRTPNARDTLIVTFLRECFPTWPFKAMRIESRGACLAPGDSMIFNFPPSEGRGMSEPERRCVVKMIGRPALPRAEEPPTCIWELGPDGKPPLQERCY